MFPSLRQRRGHVAYSGAAGASAGDAFTSHRTQRAAGAAVAPAPRSSGLDSDAHSEEGGYDGAAEREQLLSDYADRLKIEQRALLREDVPIWGCRCSWSVLVALFIWSCIGLFVWTVIMRPDSVPGAYSTLKQRYAAADHGVGGEKDQVGTAIRTAELPEGCRGDYCHKDGGSEAFGAILGAHSGVFGFSNCCAHTCISMRDNEMDFWLPAASPLAKLIPDNGEDGAADTNGTAAAAADHAADGRVRRKLVTGMKWQCVEYARRYWMLQGKPVPALFGSVEGAADIWDSLDTVTLLDGSITALLKYGNGVSRGMGGSRPRVGDLLIYPRDIGASGEPVNFPYGHVAVVVGVDEAAGLIFIAEQNWSSQPWPGPYHNYSRELELKVGDGGAYTIHDPYHAVQGWVRYAKYND